MTTSYRHWIVAALQAEIPAGVNVDHISSFTRLEDAWREIATVLDRPQEEVARALAERFHLERADLSARDPQADQLIPETRARKLGIIPLAHSDRYFTIATANPLDGDAEQEIGFLTGRAVRLTVATPDEIREFRQNTSSPEAILDDVVAHMVASDTLEDIRVLKDQEADVVTERELEKTPVVRLTNLIVQKAVEAGATDIHIEPERDGGRVRYRIDGVLHSFMHLPLPALIRVVSRIKILAQLDIADRMRPQDGRMRIEVLGRTLDLRISTVPLTGAEKVVVRVLDPEATFSLEGLGVAPTQLHQLDELMGNRNGMVLVTGPTGSGKTTTLYAALSRLSSTELNISTVEQPIEYELRGISQVQVDPRKGVTFASSLRALLRQDPDVILVGEIRDPETAEIASQASMTGHMVLSTLHTNDAVGAISRLIELGLHPSVVASTLRGVVAQRLVRTFCPSCVRDVKSRWELGPAELELVDRTGILPARWAAGCDDCRQTGLRGRAPIFEILPLTRSFARAVARGLDESELRDMLAEGSHPGLREDGLIRVRAGETSLLEIDRVVGLRDEVTDEAPVDSRHTSAAADPDRTATAVAPVEPVPDLPGIVPLHGQRASHSDATVLVVDDDAGTRHLIRATLQKAGYRVLEAEDGVEALALMEGGETPCLVTLDLNMPRMGGMAVLGHLRSSDRLQDIPVIVATHSDDEASELRLLTAGADDYVVKPIAPARLLTRVEAVLRRRPGWHAHSA